MAVKPTEESRRSIPDVLLEIFRSAVWYLPRFYPANPVLLFWSTNLASAGGFEAQFRLYNIVSLRNKTTN